MREIQVLDKGFIRLEDKMGTDLTVVNAARVSLGKRKEVLDLSDEKLIKYLSKHNHFTPFSQPQIQLHIKMPLFVARQWYKHQIGLTRNEISRRYVVEKPEFHHPELLRKQSPSIKQGSLDEPVEYGNQFLSIIKDLNSRLSDTYEWMISGGVCAEQARMILPQSIYTEFIETGSLFAYARIYKLRADLHAQREIQEYAKGLDVIMSELFPISWTCLTKNGNSS